MSVPLDYDKKLFTTLQTLEGNMDMLLETLSKSLDGLQSSNSLPTTTANEPDASSRDVS